MLTAATAGRPETVMPTTVVPGFLYLGSYDTASRQELLKAMQISDILNVSDGRRRGWPSVERAQPAVEHGTWR